MLSISVVYLLFSTSNHNLLEDLLLYHKLYIFSFLHQTTTMPESSSLNQSLYIFSFLHQTTTLASASSRWRRCISSLFYIKPQLAGVDVFVIAVVYLLFSTSNHNPPTTDILAAMLYIFSFLHQTTTQSYDFFFL